MSKTGLVSLVIFFGLALTEAWAMDAESMKVTLWKRGESIAGEEFIVMNESIVDYLATLKRPTETFGKISYTCQVKARSIRPDVYSSPSETSINRYVYLLSVYELRDCVELVPPPKP